MRTETKQNLALAAIIIALIGLLAAVGGFADDGHNETPTEINHP
jgi:hypothetical protein